MSTKTIFRKLSEIEPKSETDWRKIAAAAHRARGRAGDEAAALTQEHIIREIRDGKMEGDSRVKALD